MGTFIYLAGYYNPGSAGFRANDNLRCTVDVMVQATQPGRTLTLQSIRFLWQKYFELHANRR